MTDKTYSMELTVQAVNPDVMGMYFGKPDQPPACSVAIDQVVWVSVEPRRPNPRAGWRGLWDVATGRRRHSLRLHAIRRAAWVEAGCPKVPTQVRTYIPRATFTISEDDA